MPVAVSYPGVYVQELPSSVRTIIGVPTAVTAFVGAADRGPVNSPVLIQSFADYERNFGGLSANSPMGHMVSHYYGNGGQQAIIVRVAGAKQAQANVKLGKLQLNARSSGDWGNKLQAAVQYPKAVAGGSPNAWYNLFLQELDDQGKPAVAERYTVQVGATGPNSLPQLLRASSLVEPPGPDNLDQRPAETGGGAAPAAEPAAPAAAPAAAAPPGPSFVSFSGGASAPPVATDVEGDQAAHTGIYALLLTDIFNILCLAPNDFNSDVDAGLWAPAAELCKARRAMLLVDPPMAWGDVATAVGDGLSATPVVPRQDTATNAAVYFPQVSVPDPIIGLAPRAFPPSGVIAGIYARTDGERGVWKAPAGTDASLNGVRSLTVTMTDAENGELNPLGYNCLRSFPIYGSVCWGARTLRGADVMADQWKYVPVRRVALFIEESLYRGTKWCVFEPNAEPLWAEIRLNVGTFMRTLFNQGAFAGTTPTEAYLVKCDKDNNPQATVDQGIVNILVGFAPLKPAEFVVISIEQLAGQTAA